MLDKKDTRHAISDVLDTLDGAAQGDEVSIETIVDALGSASFASLLLVFSLISTSPASAIPGVTSVVGIISFILVVQMMAGRKSVWLPDMITRRRLETDKLTKGVKWLRPVVMKIERVLKPRMTFLFHRPWLWLPMILILGLTLFMPFMEVVPMSGSVASAVIACFAAGLLTRDGILLLVALGFLSAIPVAIYFL